MNDLRLLVGMCIAFGFLASCGGVVKKVENKEVEEWAPSPDSTVNLLAGAFPTVGDHVLSIYKNPDDSSVKLFVKKIATVDTSDNYLVETATSGVCVQKGYTSIESVSNVKVFDLSTNTIELWMASETTLAWYKLDHNKSFKENKDGKITFTSGSDAQFIRNFQYSLSPVIIGGEDTRDGYTIGKTADYVWGDLEYDEKDTRRVRVWYMNGELHLSANKHTYVVEKQYLTCKNISYKHWGKDYDIYPGGDPDACIDCSTSHP